MHISRRRWLPAALALLAAAGCVERTLDIRSDPPGATVYVDGFDLGRTPIKRVRFDFYGTREIVLAKPGHHTERRIIEISPPWWCHFPYDIVPELLLPWTLHDRRDVFVALHTSSPAKGDELLARAAELRTTARTVIQRERDATSYKPQAYAVEGDERPYILFAPFVGIPRGEPVYRGSDRPSSTEKRTQD
jgi:hypothetical protein